MLSGPERIERRPQKSTSDSNSWSVRLLWRIMRMLFAA